jgi:molecular chaperone DnaJ
MAAPARNLYDVLGVSAAADRDQIRTAFRRLAREHHPDVSAHPEAGTRFREVVEAYRTLSRPAARRLYDLFGRHGLSADAIEELARWLAVGRRRAEPEVVAEVVLGFAEAARGGTFAVEVETAWTCASCAGGGAEPGSATERCGSCGGSGRLRRSTKLGDGRLLQIESCPECDGSGGRPLRPCAVCCGAGRVRGRRRVEVRVPAGTTDADTLPVELDGREATVTVRVRPLPDSPVIRYAALTLLAVALAFLGFLLSL